MESQLSLFADKRPMFAQERFLGIEGLTYYPMLLDRDEQERVIGEVDRLPWQSDLSRRVQHYGYRYDYKARTIDESMRVQPLPPFARWVGEQLLQLGVVNEMPDQLIVNEYQPGQGIAAHIDCEPCFGDRIITVSLGSAYEMDFIHSHTKEVRSVILNVGSALVLVDDARYLWMHRIRPRTSDHGIARGRRVSLTFRNVILKPQQAKRRNESSGGEQHLKRKRQ